MLPSSGAADKMRSGVLVGSSHAEKVRVTVMRALGEHCVKWGRQECGLGGWLRANWQGEDIWGDSRTGTSGCFDKIVH